MECQFIFDYLSPYAYLSNTQLATLPGEVEVIPVDIVSVMNIVGNQPSPACPPKGRYASIDAARWAKLYDVPFQANASLVEALMSGALEGSLLSRAGAAAKELRVFDRAHPALFRATWGVPVDLATVEGRQEFLRANGIDVDIWAKAESTEIKQLMDKRVKEMAEKGVFGVPTFLVGDEMFFGNDRLDFVRAEMKKLAA